MTENFKISVIGSGTMGNGIAHVFAQSGFKTLLIDIDKNQLNKISNIFKTETVKYKNENHPIIGIPESNNKISSQKDE